MEAVRQAVRGDRRLTVRMIAEQVGIDRQTVWEIITEELRMRKICAKMVPKLLSDDQKARRMQVCEDTLQNIENDPELLTKVITGDETWVFEYDPETKRQSKQWLSPNSPRPKKARQSRSQIKVMLIAFFDARGIVHAEFIPQGQTINQHVYQSVLKNLLAAIRRKRSELFDSNTWLLHHDNAPAHSALSVHRFLAEKHVSVLDQPPYSPDLAPCDFFLFPRLKGIVKGIRFVDVEAIKEAVTRELKAIPEQAFQECMVAWQRRMERCVEQQGDYFEGCERGL